MDRRDAMAIPGSASFYMQRGMAGSGPGASTSLNVQSGVNPLSNTNVAFQSSIGASTMPVPIEPSAAISPPGVNVGAPSTAVASTGDTVKRKRGRPRKYGPDGSVSLVLSSPSSSTHPGTITPTQKRGRGRPPGTGRKQQLASLGGWLSGSAGIGFTPHVILISVGEDIASKIMSFSQQGPRAICVLSANGSVSTVTLCQPSTSGGSVTYEGCFEILCLSGSYLLTDDGGSRNRTGGLSISLASPDGRVIGGGVGGMLIAASPVQVILGSFMWGGPKTKNKRAGPEGARGSDHQTAENPVTTSSHNLAATSSAGVWPDSQPVDMRNAHVDIDLMRGL